MSEADNKTSDKNVANIEEDIKYVKEMLEIARVFFKAVKAETNYKDVDDVAFCNAIEHILAEREQMTKRYEERDDELYERVKQCNNLQTEIDRLYTDKEELQQVYLHEKLAKEEIEEILEESIPKQKIKEMLEESQTLYEKKIKEIDFEELKSISLNIFEGIKLEVERGLLRRLLQESEDK